MYENVFRLVQGRVGFLDFDYDVNCAERSVADMSVKIYGNAPFARGHVDCVEVLTGKEAMVKAIPIVCVRDERAKVTHEAAIGSVDKKQIETLMARGLTEEEAIDVIVRGVLR